MSNPGIFIRQVLGQQPSDVSQGSCGCPDVILTGRSLQVNPPPSWFATSDGYAWMSASDVYLNQPNFVYIRGMQSFGYTGGSNLFFYYVPSSLALWPQSWQSAQVMVGSAGTTPQNWAYAPALPGNPIVLTQEPLIWTPPTIDLNVQHYCVVVWADNQPASNPVPPDLAHWGQMGSFDELMIFLARHPNMGWRNTADHYLPPPDLTYRTAISTGDNPELVNISVDFNNITDGTFMVNVAGPGVSFSSGPNALSVSNYLGGYQIKGLQFGANVNALLSVTFTVGSPLGQYSNISAEIAHVLSPMMMDTLFELPQVPGHTLPIKPMALELDSGGVSVQNVFILGRQQWNLKFANAGT